MKKPVPNEDHISKWDMSSSESFLKDCVNYYQNKRSCCYGFYEKPNYQIIDYLYKLGRDYLILNCDYNHFVAVVTGQYRKKYLYYGYLKTPYRTKHEEGVCWKEKGKKEISEERQANLDWRSKKGIDKDKKKHGSRKRGCPKWVKRYSNKTLRQWERDCLKKGKWDELGSSDYLYFLDPWLWD